MVASLSRTLAVAGCALALLPVFSGCSESKTTSVSNLTCKAGEYVSGNECVSVPPMADLGTSWTNQFNLPSFDAAKAIALLPDGNLVVAGYASQPIPEQSGTAPAARNIYVAKLQATDGAVLWRKEIGTDFLDEVTAVGVDSTGAIFLAGNTFGSLEGTRVVGNSDAVVLKLGSDGAVQWVHQLSSSGDDFANSLTVVPDGVVVVGTTSGVLDASAGLKDAFAAKYATNGDLLWKKQFGSSQNDNATSVCADAQGNIYVGGSTEGAFQFGSLPANTFRGVTDGFIAKMDASGGTAAGWVVPFGTDRYDAVTAINCNPNGNIYVGGETFGVLGAKSIGSQDIFVASLTPTGQAVWPTPLQAGSASDDTIRALLLLNNAGNTDIILAGYTGGDFLPGKNHGSSDGYLAHVSSTGTLASVKEMGTVVADFIDSAVLSSDGSVYFAGNTEGNLTHMNNGGKDSYIAKMLPF